MARPKKVVDEDVDLVHEPTEPTLVEVEFLYNVIVGGRIYNKGEVVSLERALVEFLVRDGYVRYSK